jgi:hypothetical protein
VSELQYSSWRDFTERVCRPWVENDDSDPDDVPEAFAAVPPFYLAVGLVMADNALREQT